MSKRIAYFSILLIVAVACTPTSTSPKNDESTQNESSINKGLSIILQNEGKYPREIKLMENDAFSKRMKSLLGDAYQTMKDNFQTETPIVSEDGIYKITGCKQHDCPAFMTSIYYDAKKDNLYVIIEKGEDKQSFLEKEAITITNTLKMK